MNIYHQESGITFSIHEGRDRCEVHSSNGKAQSFKQSYEAIWWVIDIIRKNTLDTIDEDSVREIAKKWHLYVQPAAMKPFLSVMKREKMHRTYYDQLFLKWLSQQRSGQHLIEVSSKTNFMVEHEVAYFIRTLVPLHQTINDSVWA